MVQLTYDMAQANTRLGGEAYAVLAWLNPSTNTYHLAVQGTTVGSAQFVGDRAYNVAIDFQVGLYGVDTANHFVWAVVNRGGGFVASNPAAAPISGVPVITSAAIAPVLKGAAFSYYLTFPNNGNIFGCYAYLSAPNYIYHFDLGFEYVLDANDGKGGV